MTKSPAGSRKHRLTAPSSQLRQANRATQADKTRAAADVPTRHQGATKPATVPKATTAIRRKPQRAPAEFPIVGIGALAGGLDALEQFLAQVPDGSGMASDARAWPAGRLPKNFSRFLMLRQPLLMKS